MRPDLVCGTSVGSLVGAAYAAGELDRFEQWLLALRIRDVLGFMDLGLGGGVLKGERVMEFFRRNFVDRPIQDLPMPFAAVATALQSGDEIWLRDGSTVDAVHASIALPGLFTPVLRNGLLLVDGGLVNPVPVSLARSMGADIVVAVDLGSDKVGRRLAPRSRADASGTLLGEWQRRLRDSLGGRLALPSASDRKLPGLHEVLLSSLDIMQTQIARSRLAAEPADIVVSPRLAQLHLLDFHRAKEAIEEGRRATEAALDKQQSPFP
jgi:NTE family protein